MASTFMLVRGSWVGLTDVPAKAAGFLSSPIFVTQVQPMKTGAGLLQIEFVQPLHPGGSRAQKLVGKVVQQTPAHCTCVYEEDNEKRVAVFAGISWEWLQTHCPEMLRRRPPFGPVFIIEGQPIEPPVVADHLAHIFGSTEADILAGTTAASFSVSPHAMPKAVSLASLNAELEPFDACLVARGFRPAQMEDKWFIYLEDGHLVFRRSWTGFIVYRVEATWRGDRLYLGQVQMNRNSEQYQETDDSYDLQVLRYVINVVLRGVGSEFPMKDETDDTAQLKAWSTAGSASLI